ncbi:MAG: hypothetical protein ABH828_01530 [archaeon]
MNVKKAIKQIVALGSGLTMIGATIMGATADLGAYPAPFVQNGVFSGKIVVGANAATSDVLGSIDISAGLQAEAKTATTVEGAGSVTVVEGGVKVAKSSTDFNWEDTLSGIDNKFDNSEGEFPVLMADGVVEDDDGTDYDYEQELYLPDWTLVYGRPSTAIFDDPVVYLDVDAQTTYMEYKVIFNDALDASLLDASEAITLFGSEYTFKDVDDDDKLVLYGSDVTQLVSMNNPIDVEVDGTTYTLDIVGAQSDATGGASVHVSVNGEVKSMQSGDDKTINGLKVHVLDVFVSNIGGESASAKVFIGSRELELEAAGSDTTYSNVKEDSATLDGVKVLVHATTDNNDIDYIIFRIDPSLIDNEDTGKDYDWLEMGETFKDPLFGFEVYFAEAVPDLMEDRTLFEMRKNGDDLEVSFTNWEGNSHAFDIYKELGDGANFTWSNDFFYGTTGTDIADSKYFILEEDAGNEDVSIVYEVEGIDTGETPNEVTLRNLMTDKSTTYQTGDEIDDTNVNIYVESATAVNLSATPKLYVRTMGDLKVIFESVATVTEDPTINFLEDESGVLSDEKAGADWNYDLDIDTDGDINIITLTEVTGDVYTATNDGSSLRTGVTEYGSYIEYDEDNKEWLKVYVPAEDVDYNVFFNGPAAVVSTSTSADGTYYDVNPIGVGIGVLDSDAPALGTTPMIVVGGPCVNTVAAELMGNQADCAAGFEEGKAIIKYFGTSNAILVAGYSAMDTQGASRVLADYADWGLTGTEVEVVVPSLSSISVNPVA